MVPFKLNQICNSQMTVMAATTDRISGSLQSGYHDIIFFLIEIKSNCKWGRPIQAVIIQFWVMAGFWNYPAGQSFCIFRLLPVTDTFFFFFFEISNISTGSVRNCSIINVPCVCVRAQAICTWMPLSRSIMNNRSSNWEIHCFFFFYDC